MENRFAAARRRYLREHRDGIYTGMLLTGKLDEVHIIYTRMVNAMKMRRRWNSFCPSGV